MPDNTACLPRPAPPPAAAAAAAACQDPGLDWILSVSRSATNAPRLGEFRKPRARGWFSRREERLCPEKSERSTAEGVDSPGAQLNARALILWLLIPPRPLASSATREFSPPAWTRRRAPSGILKQVLRDRGQNSSCHRGIAGSRCTIFRCKSAIYSAVSVMIILRSP